MYRKVLSFKMFYALIVRYLCIKPLCDDMAELFYQWERDSEFYNICESVRKSSASYMSVADIVAVAIKSPARSFFLHPREYSNIIKRDGRELPKNAIKRELHKEILRRSREIKRNSPDLRSYEIAKIIGDMEAPRFYISEKRAIDLYYKLLKHNPQ